MHQTDPLRSEILLKRIKPIFLDIQVGTRGKWWKSRLRHHIRQGLPPVCCKSVKSYGLWTRRRHIRPVYSHPHNPPLSYPLSSLRLQYLPADKVPNRETTTKQAAPRFLNGHARDILQTARKEGCDHTWRHSWYSHPLDGRHPTDYNRLDWSLSPSFPFHHSLGYAQHAGSFVPCRWHRPLQERWETGVWRSYVCPLIASLKYTMNLNPTSTPSSVLLDKITARTKIDADHKWLIESLTVVCLKELDAGQRSTGRSSYHCCSREAWKTSWNIIDAGKPAPQVSPSSCVPVHKMYALSSFSLTSSLIYTMQLNPIHQRDYSLLPPPLFVTNHSHDSSNSTWRWSKTQEMANRVPRSSLSQRARCGQWSARSSS